MWRRAAYAIERVRFERPTARSSETVRHRQPARQASRGRGLRWCRVDRRSTRPARCWPRPATLRGRSTSPARAGWTRVPRSRLGSTSLSSSTFSSFSASFRRNSSPPARTHLHTSDRLAVSRCLFTPHPYWDEQLLNRTQQTYQSPESRHIYTWRPYAPLPFPPYKNGDTMSDHWVTWCILSII